MADTRALLNRIAAFRERLENTPPLGPSPGTAAVTGLAPVAGAVAAPTDRPAAQLTTRARRLIDHQRRLSADRLVADTAPLARFHHGTVGLTESAVRLVQTFPAAAEAQLRACDGLEQLLRAVRDRLTVTDHALAARRADKDRIDQLAGLLTALNQGHEVALEPLAALAEGLIEDARRGLRIRFLTADPAAGPDAWAAARCVAAHALTVGQVAARL